MRIYKVIVEYESEFYVYAESEDKAKSAIEDNYDYFIDEDDFDYTTREIKPNDKYIDRKATLFDSDGNECNETSIDDYLSEIENTNKEVFVNPNQSKLFEEEYANL